MARLRIMTRRRDRRGAGVSALALAVGLALLAPDPAAPTALGGGTALAQGNSGNAPGQSGGSPGNSGDAPGQSGGSPGNSGDAPGQSGGSPGNSGDAPGQSGDSPGNSGDAPGQSGGSPGNSGDAPGQDDDSPGNSGDAPGQDGDSPGNSDDAPGQDDDSPGNSGDAPGQDDSGPSGGSGGETEDSNDGNPGRGATDDRTGAAVVPPATRGRYNARGTTGAAPPTTSVAQADDEGGSFSERIGDVAVELDADATRALIESGWAGAGAAAPDTASAPDYAFDDQADRVRSFVTLARALNERYAGEAGFDGVPVAAAALQASFGTPWEAGLLERPARGAEGEPLGPNDRPATDDPAELQRRIDAMEPGNAAVEGWETITALDVNGDGFVDRKDLIDLEAGMRPAILGADR